MSYYTIMGSLDWAQCTWCWRWEYGMYITDIINRPLATDARDSRNRRGGPTTGSGASYLSGECLVMASITITNTGSGLLDAWSSIGICAASLLRLCQNHGCRDARKTIVPSEIARNSEPLAGLASLCQTFSEGD